MAKAPNGKYVLYIGSESFPLELQVKGSRLARSSLNRKAVSGTFAAGSAKLTMVLDSPGKRVRRQTYEGYPLADPGGNPKVNAADNLWGWAGTCTHELDPVRPSLRPQTRVTGWWARIVTGFADDIRPLFRQVDIDAMRGSNGPFDLSRYEDVHARAYQIFKVIDERLPTLMMPCDKPWPYLWTDLFKHWMNDGYRR